MQSKRMRVAVATLIASALLLGGLSSTANASEVGAAAPTELQSCGTGGHGHFNIGNIQGVELWQAGYNYSCSSSQVVITTGVAMVSASPPNGNAFANVCALTSSCTVVSLPVAVFLLRICSSVGVGAAGGIANPAFSTRNGC
jgi:hypothetical protein